MVIIRRRVKTKKKNAKKRTRRVQLKKIFKVTEYVVATCKRFQIFANNTEVSKKRKEKKRETTGLTHQSKKCYHYSKLLTTDDKGLANFKCKKGMNI